MKVLVIDGQGGGIGRQIIESIKKTYPDVDVTAVGTNVLATQAMIKAGANQAATGENAVIVNCRTADVIIGPIGIVIADSLLGEITPRIAVAVAQSSAERILLPMNLCSNYIAGYTQINTSKLIEDCLARIGQVMLRNR
ncbi:MAG: DUF3842 family protein [Clostridiales bacterium]|nr:DUF3842 family protein [Candidatus Cacconaster stercorequi]